MNNELFPILEFDSDHDAIINPNKTLENGFVFNCDMLIITFFKEVIEELLKNGLIEHYCVLRGENKLNVYKYVDSDILLIHGIIGGPACGGFLDELIGLGVNKIMFCGGGGVLDKNITVGKLIVVDGSIRDDGMSYHYEAPSRVIYSNRVVKVKIEEYLKSKSLPYISGLTWTTDAFYRETREKIKKRKQEGALVVEMEQAGCIAVSKFRNVMYGAIIYGGDDISGEEWDMRNWIDRNDIRYNLVKLCKEILKGL